MLTQASRNLVTFRRVIMHIHGLQKMTLLDFPGHIACTVFLGGCDFGCSYCHNYELVDGSIPPEMVEEDFFSFLSKRQGLLDGVAITGGEPLMRPGIDNFIRKIRDLGFLIKLDTNGYHPRALQQLIAGGLVDYVAMDIKNSLPKYALTVGLPQIDTGLIEQSVSIIMNSKIDYEFRTTVVKEFHEEKDFEFIGQWIRGAKAYYLQQFTPRDTVPDKTLTSPTSQEMELFLGAVKPYVEAAAIRGI